jgi:hypothetical protein
MQPVPLDFTPRSQLEPSKFFNRIQNSYIKMQDAKIA